IAWDAHARFADERFSTVLVLFLEYLSCHHARLTARNDVAATESKGDCHRPPRYRPLFRGSFETRLRLAGIFFVERLRSVARRNLACRWRKLQDDHCASGNRDRLAREGDQFVQAFCVLAPAGNGISAEQMIVL